MGIDGCSPFGQDRPPLFTVQRLSSRTHTHSHRFTETRRDGGERERRGGERGTRLTGREMRGMGEGLWGNRWTKESGERGRQKGDREGERGQRWEKGCGEEKRDMGAKGRG